MLNDVMIKSLPVPASGVAQHPDGKIPGFGVRVTSSGVKTFYLKYRHGGQYARLNLGRDPTTTLAKARAKAHAALAGLAEGLDPRGEERAQSEDLSFAAILDAFLENYCRHNNRASTAAETERLLRVYFLPEWKNRRVTDIAKADVAAALQPIMKRKAPSAARHAFAAARKLFNWCVEQGLVEDSPCRTMKPPVKAASRDRVLTDDELALVWRTSIEQGDTFGIVVRLLPLTAQRRGEVCGMSWNELDLQQGIWTIPGSRTKNHRAHALPLTPTTVEILKSLPRLDDSPLVFPARGKLEQAYTGYSKGKRMLDKAIDKKRSRAAVAAGGKPDDVTDINWTLHDLRRTAATGMAKLAVPPHVIERILNHATGTFGGVAGVYNRFQYLPEMRQGLQVWEEHLFKTVAAASESDRFAPELDEEAERRLSAVAGDKRAAKPGGRKSRAQLTVASRRGRPKV